MIGHRQTGTSHGGALAVAGVTAIVSGVSVYVNSFAVRDFTSPAVYTTAKNLVAAVLLSVGFLAAGSRGARAGSVSREQPRRAGDPRRAGRAALQLLGLAYVGIVGGGIAFVLFFDGLAKTAAAPAAFLHDALVVFVAAIAWPLLRERLSVVNLVAIAVLVGGEVAIVGGIGHLGAGDGPALVLLATVCWAVETVVAKRLLAEGSPAAQCSPGLLAGVRMGVGVVVLFGYLALDGRLGTFASLDLHQWAWALACGALLAGYVATWFVALAGARAVDVTSILVGSVIVTSLLQALDGRALPGLGDVGIVLVALGVIAAVAGSSRRATALSGGR